MTLLSSPAMPAATDLLVKADLYRLLSTGFSYPDPDTLNALNAITKGLLQQRLVPDTMLPLLTVISTEIDPKTLRQEFSRIFIQGGVPVTESHNTTTFSSVSDVSAYYAAFGFIPKTGETPDAITYELEFAALLLVKTALAPHPEAQTICEEAYLQFLNEHLSDFANAFARKILAGDARPFYKNMAVLLLQLLQGEWGSTGFNHP